MKKENFVLAGFIAMCIIFMAPVSLAEINPNYGTTTFFSDKTEKPSDNPPVYDAGLKSGSKKSNNNSDVDKNKYSDEGSSLFDKFINEMGAFFGDSDNITHNTSKESLFDLQEKSNQGLDGDFSSNVDSEFIMGARGESYENMNAEDINNYNNRIAAKFNFRDDGSQAAPKKSKLLFTNIIIPVDMTTQYIIVILAVLTALGSVVWYYFWKKEMDKAEKKSKEENYD